MTSSLDEQLRMMTDEEGEAHVNMKRSHSVRAQSSGKRVNRSPQHRTTTDRNPADACQYDELRSLTADIVDLPQGVNKKRVRFASTCKLIVFPRVKAKYDQRIWYKDADFSNFKKDANEIVESIQAYKGTYDKIISELGGDCVLGLERTLSNKIIESRRQWRLSASITVFSVQSHLRQQTVMSDGDERYNYWSAWESIAQYYRKATARSKAYALDLAGVYATSNPIELNQRMVWLLGSIDCEVCASSTSLQSTQPFASVDE